MDYHRPDPRPDQAMKALSTLGRIGARVWLVIGLVVVVLLGLTAWAGIALLSWLWGQVPMATEAGRRIAGEAATQIERTAPGLKDQIGQWVPGVTEATDKFLVDPAAQSVERDVSGTDIGPVPRFTGLARSHFARREGFAEVRYAGAAAFDAVRDHYINGFATAGYAPEVIEATPESEHHRFAAGQEVIELWLLRGPMGRVEVRLKASEP